MNVAATSAMSSLASVTPLSPERMEGPGPDHDGDADDAGAQAPVRAALPQGTGKIVDKTA